MPFWSFLWPITHYFGVHGRFSGSRYSIQSLRSDVKKLNVFTFLAVFGAYCTQLGSRDDFGGRDTHYKVGEGISKNSSLSPFWPFFVAYCTLFWGPGTIVGVMKPNKSLRSDVKNSSFYLFGRCVAYCTVFRGLGMIMAILTPNLRF